MHRLINEENYQTEEAAIQVASQTKTIVEPANKSTGQRTDLFGGEIVPFEKTAAMSLREKVIEDPLYRYRALDEIAERGWQIPTNELAAILGMKNLSNETFVRHGFRFVRAGKAGSENTWKVEKL